VQVQEPLPAQPTLLQDQPAKNPEPLQLEELDLDLPTFLRRQKGAD
jgi:hypothetical protein